MKSWLQENWFKIIAAGVLLGASGSHPYAYYQLLRWVVTLSAGFTAYKAYEQKRYFWMWLFTALAVLFNPIAPIYMSKENWQGPDVIAALIFVISMFFPLRKKPL